MNAIEKRRQQIADGIAAGEKGQRELADARHGADGIMQEARQKAAQVVDLAHKRSNELVGEAKHAAAAEGERLVAAARSEAANEQTRARDGLRREVAALAVAGATRLLGREVDASTHAKLLEELAAQIEGQAPTHG
jgi:F-type H+-transporting ATPase subunit b